jgi:hypothetical protein
MTLTEITIITGVPLKITQKNGEYMVDFEELAEIKVGHVLKSVFSRARNLTLAKKYLAEKLQGQILVFDAMLDTRREYQLPPKITIR